MKDVKLIIVGYGNIGQGLVKALHEKKGQLAKSGVNPKVVAICEAKGCIVEPKGIDLGKLIKSKPKWGNKKTLDVIEGVDADIVVELTPGNISSGEPGLKHMMAALKSKKHVVTSNKSPLALKYAELMKLAKENGVKLRFEASVGGAIPVVNTFERELKANSVRNIYGILNGTTNYILSKMTEEGVDFNSALKEAQELGYAESDPENDISGKDSAVKVVILANALMGANIKMSDLKVEGIKSITPEAIEVAAEYGYTIKLIGDVAAREVSPRLIPVEHQLNVGGNLNAILVETDLAQDITLIGHGAGPAQTSSAILSDIIAVAGSL